MGLITYSVLISQMVLFAPVPVQLLIFQKHFQLLFSFPSSDCYAAWRETRSIWISFAHLHTVTRRPSPTIVWCKRSQSHFQSASEKRMSFKCINSNLPTLAHSNTHLLLTHHQTIYSRTRNVEFRSTFVLLLGLFASLISGLNFLIKFTAAPGDNCVNCCDLW